MNYAQILACAKKYEKEMVKFLRDMIAIPSESSQEERVIQRIKEEMIHVGFDRVEIDPMGNIYGYLGSGSHLIAMDAHIDTVGVGLLSNWTVDPYLGAEDEHFVYGRGASDQEGGMASMVYAAKIINELDLKEDYTLLVVGSVQEEDCDGLCWQYIIEEQKIRPEFVVITEPTSLNIYRGHRGRMEIKVTTQGVSCHGSAPERGDNAIYKMARIIQEVEALHPTLQSDPFLGKGTLTVSEIFFSSPSRCAVADGCSISIDRRLTKGEDDTLALSQIRNLPSVKQYGAQVEMYDYARPSYTGLVYPTKSYFPTWVLEEEHLACQTLKHSYIQLFEEQPKIDKWTFSTNAVSIMGRFGIPCIGFGPGHEVEAHAPNEKTVKLELVKAAAMYATIPSQYLSMLQPKGESYGTTI